MSNDDEEKPQFLFKIFVQERHENLEAICDILGNRDLMKIEICFCFKF